MDKTLRLSTSERVCFSYAKKLKKFQKSLDFCVRKCYNNDSGKRKPLITGQAEKGETNGRNERYRKTCD